MSDDESIHQSNDETTRRRRALYRASHRGTKELDIMIGRYAQARLGALEGEALARFERFLTVADPKLQAWLFDPSLVDIEEFRGLIGDVRSFHGLVPPETAN